MNLPKPEIDRENAIRLWISEHSEYAKEQIVLNNTGLIGNALKSLNLNPLDEDLFSIGLVGLIKEINTFDFDKNNMFSTYAVPVIKNEILMIFRKKRIIPDISLDEPLGLENGKEIPYGITIQDKRIFEEEVISRKIVKDVISSFSEREKQILLLRTKGKDQKEIAKIMGLSQSQICRIIKNAYVKCKERIG